jgi:hypothetical protein
MLKSFNRSNPCPVCGEASPDCRYSTDGELVLCHSHTDFDPQHPEWHYVRISSNGVWGVFVPRKSEAFDRTEWESKKLQRERDQLERQKEHAKNALSIPDRDKSLRKLSQSLGLSRRHQKALLDRGLSESAIESGLFFSIYPNDDVPPGIPPNLPGVINGKIAAGAVGIACPAFDGEGQAIGYQIRLENVTDSKYRWAKGVESSHLADGELPITVIPNGKDKSQVWLSEGILKPFVAAHKHGLNAIGAAGGHFSGAANQVRNAIGPYRQLILCPDAGDINNPQVMLRWSKEIKFLESLGKSVLVAFWGQKTKDDDDIDELSSLEGIEFIECSKFLAMGKIPAQSPQLPNQKDWDKWHKFHRFTAKEKINQQYLDIDPPKKGEILIVNSPTNTGKSTLLKKWSRVDFAELGIIRIGNRNSLELQFCNESDFYHLQSEKELSDTLLSNPKKRVSFCFPSLIYTNSDHWENTVIYGDEIDGTIQQALFLNKDPDNLDRFKEALELCDRAVFLSGTLYDHHIEYLKALCPSKTLRIVGNTYQPERPKFKLLAGTFKEENPDKINSRDKSPLLDRILSDHEPIMIQSDSKHFLNSLERLIKNIPDTDTLLVTSDTLITDKKVKAFIENPNQYIKEYADRNTRRLVVLASPTMTSGNDINIKYFKRDYHYYCGQLSSVLISQKIIRIRDTDCERIISIPEYITSDDAEKCEYLDQWQNSLIMAEINSLDEPENKAELIKKLTDSLESPHYKEACISKWIRDFERKNYRECLIKLLTQQGYEIELISDKKSESENTKKLKEVSNEIKDETSEAIYNASDKYIGKDERSIEPETKDDLMAAEKAKIIGQLPSIHYSESWSSELVRLVKYDKPRLIQQLNRRYLLHNPDTLKTLTAKRYHRHGQRVTDGKTTDLWRDKNNLAFINAIEKIGLKDWVEDAIANNTQFTNSDPSVTEIIAKCHSKAISNALGRRPGKDSIKYLSWLLGTLGYELTAKRVRGGEARGERRYSIREACQNAQFLSEIGDAIERRYDKINANCTTLEWAFLGENETPKNQTSENDSNPDIPVVLVGTDHPNTLIEVIEPSGPKVYQSDDLNQDEIYLATDYLAAAGKDSLLSEFRGCLDCVTRPKWSSFLAIIPTPIRETLLGLIAAARQDSLLNEFTDAIAEVF